MSDLPLTIDEEIEALRAELAMVKQQPTSETVADLGRAVLPVMRRVSSMLAADTSGNELVGRMKTVLRLLDKRIASDIEFLDGGIGDEQ